MNYSKSNRFLLWHLQASIHCMIILKLLRILNHCLLTHKTILWSGSLTIHHKSQWHNYHLNGTSLFQTLASFWIPIDFVCVYNIKQRWLQRFRVPYLVQESRRIAACSLCTPTPTWRLYCVVCCRGRGCWEGLRVDWGRTFCENQNKHLHYQKICWQGNSWILWIVGIDFLYN